MALNTTNTLLALDTGVAVSAQYDVSFDASANDITEQVVSCTYYTNYTYSDLSNLFDVSVNDAGIVSGLFANTDRILASLQTRLREGSVVSTKPSDVLVLDTDFNNDTSGTTRSTLLEDLEQVHFTDALSNFKIAVKNKFTSGGNSTADTDDVISTLAQLGIINSDIANFDFTRYRDNLVLSNNASAPINLIEEVLDAEDFLSADGTKVDFNSLPEGYCFAIALTAAGSITLKLTISADTNENPSSNETNLEGELSKAPPVITNSSAFSEGSAIYIALRKYNPE